METLYTPVADIIADEAALNRAALSLSAARGDSNYGKSLNHLLKVAQSNPHATLETIVRDADFDVNEFSEDLKTLAAGEAAQARAREQAKARIRQLDIPPVDGAGYVRLTKNDDPATWLHDPIEKDRRWRQARTLDPRYADPVKGAQRWAADDKSACDAGYDLLGTLRHGQQLKQAARAAEPSQKLTRGLDAAFQRGRDASDRRRLLMQAIGRYDQSVKLLDGEMPRSAPNREKQESEVRTLDDTTTSRYRHVRQLALDDQLANRQLDAFVRAEIKRRGLRDRDYARVLEEVLSK
jgi:hypothetical protein